MVNERALLMCSCLCVCVYACECLIVNIPITYLSSFRTSHRRHPRHGKRRQQREGTIKMSQDTDEMGL